MNYLVIWICIWKTFWYRGEYTGWTCLLSRGVFDRTNWQSSELTLIICYIQLLLVTELLLIELFITNEMNNNCVFMAKRQQAVLSCSVTVSYSGRCRTLLAIGGDQRARWDLGGGAAWWSFPPRILGYSTVVSLTPSLGVGRGAWKGRSTSGRSLSWCAMVSVLYRFSSIVVYSISISYPMSTFHHSFDHSALENLVHIETRWFNNKKSMFFCWLRQYTPADSCKTHQSHLGQWPCGSEACGWTRRCAVPWRDRQAQKSVWYLRLGIFSTT